MPHFKVWHFGPELPVETREEFASELTQLAVRVFSCAPEAVSIDEIGVEPARWNDSVYDVEIAPQVGRLAREPGYTL